MIEHGTTVGDDVAGSRRLQPAAAAGSAPAGFARQPLPAGGVAGTAYTMFPASSAWRQLMVIFDATVMRYIVSLSSCGLIAPAALARYAPG
jgi:hypothetical protein